MVGVSQDEKPPLSPQAQAILAKAQAYKSNPQSFKTPTGPGTYEQNQVIQQQKQDQRSANFVPQTPQNISPGMSKPNISISQSTLNKVNALRAQEGLGPLSTQENVNVVSPTHGPEPKPTIQISSSQLQKTNALRAQQGLAPLESLTKVVIVPPTKGPTPPINATESTQQTFYPSNPLTALAGGFLESGASIGGLIIGGLAQLTGKPILGVSSIEDFQQKQEKTFGKSTFSKLLPDVSIGGPSGITIKPSSEKVDFTNPTELASLVGTGLFIAATGGLGIETGLAKAGIKTAETIGSKASQLTQAIKTTEKVVTPKTENVFYHGTTQEAAQNILEHGFDLGKSKTSQGTTFLASHIEGAQGWAGPTGPKVGNEVILAVKLKENVKVFDVNKQGLDILSSGKSTKEQDYLLRQRAQKGGYDIIENLMQGIPQKGREIELVNPKAVEKTFIIKGGGLPPREPPKFTGGSSFKETNVYLGRGIGNLVPKSGGGLSTLKTPPTPPSPKETPKEEPRTIQTKSGQVLQLLAKQETKQVPKATFKEYPIQLGKGELKQEVKPLSKQIQKTGLKTQAQLKTEQYLKQQQQLRQRARTKTQEQGLLFIQSQKQKQQTQTKTQQQAQKQRQGLALLPKFKQPQATKQSRIVGLVTPNQTTTQPTFAQLTTNEQTLPKPTESVPETPRRPGGFLPLFGGAKSGALGRVSKSGSRRQYIGNVPLEDIVGVYKRSEVTYTNRSASQINKSSSKHSKLISKKTFNF